MMANQSQFGGAVRRRKQWNPGAQQYRYDSNFDAIDEASIKEGAEQVAPTKQPNVFSALSFQASYPTCIQLGQDSYVGMLLLFESSRENDGGNSGESRESRFTSRTDSKFEGSPAHHERIKLRPKRAEIDFRVRANPVVFFVRPCYMAIQAHRNRITNFAHMWLPPSNEFTPQLFIVP
jgi:hypothetical protein